MWIDYINMYFIESEIKLVMLVIAFLSSWQKMLYRDDIPKSFAI